MYRLRRYISIILLSLFPLLYVQGVLAENIPVTGYVEPTVNSVTVSASSDRSDTLKQSNRVKVTISYTTEADQKYPLTIVASWTKGLIDGTDFNYIDLFNYVIGSATEGDGDIKPTIDINERRIVWKNIQTPADQAKHSVSFMMDVRSDIPTERKVHSDFAVKSLFNNTIDLPEVKFSQTAQFDQALVELTPTPSPTPSTSTTTSSIKPTVTSVSITDLRSTSATTDITFSEPSQFRVRYGTDINNLSQNIASAALQKSASFTLPNLIQNTTYYFTVEGTSQSGQSINSDIFTFKTASSGETVNINRQDIVIRAGKIQLSSKTTDSVVIPKEQAINLSFKLDNPEKIAKVIAKFKNAHVLGISTFSSTNSPEAVEETQFVEILPGIYSGEVQSPKKEGDYSLVLEIHDIYSGLQTKVLPYSIYVSPPITIVDKKTNEPIENATVTILRYDTNLQKFVPLEQGFSIAKKTDVTGQLPLSLSPGTYILDVSALGYVRSKTRVELGISENMYPHIMLEESHNLTDRIAYMKNAFSEVVTYFLYTAENFFTSKTAKDTTFAFSFLVVLLLVLTLFSVQLRMGILGLPLYFIEAIVDHIKHLIDPAIRHKTVYVYNASKYNTVLSGVILRITNSRNHLVFVKTSNTLGRINVPSDVFQNTHYPLKFTLYHKGYTGYPIMLDKVDEEEHTFRFEMTEDNSIESFHNFLNWFIDTSLLFLVDIFVIVLLVFSALFVYYQGFKIGYLFIVESGLIFLIWMVYIKDMWVLHRK